MIKFPITAITILTIVFASCTSGDKNAHEGHDMSNAGKDSTQHATNAEDKEIKTVAASFTDVDAKAAAAVKTIVDHYLHVKNALANDNASEAASGGDAMATAISKLDKSLLTPDQKKLFDENQDDMKEHAEHIGKNGDNIKHQRSHFSMLSEDMYALVKAFGGGQTIYHDHCPMYKEEKGGAMWLSETKEVKNPYFGSQMLKCGTVEEVIK